MARKSKRIKHSKAEGGHVKIGSHKLTHSGGHNILMLGLILVFMILLAPLAFIEAQNSATGYVTAVEEKNDDITAMATGFIMDSSITTTIMVVLAIAFLIPVELLLRKEVKRNK